MLSMSTESTERLVTLREISAVLSVPLFAVRRAAKNREFPTYQIGNGRRRARLSEVLAAIERHSAQ